MTVHQPVSTPISTICSTGMTLASPKRGHLPLHPTPGSRSSAHPPTPLRPTAADPVNPHRGGAGSAAGRAPATPESARQVGTPIPHLRPPSARQVAPELTQPTWSIVTPPCRRPSTPSGSGAPRLDCRRGGAIWLAGRRWETSALAEEPAVGASYAVWDRRRSRPTRHLTTTQPTPQAGSSWECRPGQVALETVKASTEGRKPLEDIPHIHLLILEDRLFGPCLMCVGAGRSPCLLDQLVIGNRDRLMSIGRQEHLGGCDLGLNCGEVIRQPNAFGTAIALLVPAAPDHEWHLAVVDDCLQRSGVKAPATISLCPVAIHP